MQFSTRSKLFLSHFLAIVLVSGSIGTYFYTSAVDNLKRSLQSRLLNSAAILSKVFSSSQLGQLDSPDDVATDTYRDLRTLIQSYADSNKDIAFIYIMRKQNNQAVFVLDSDPDEPASPGEPYDVFIPELMQGFERPSVDSEITSDKWGSFLSGYAPLHDGAGNYLIGIDMFADEVEGKMVQLRQAGLISLSVSVLLAVIFSIILSRNFTQRIEQLVKRCGEIARARLDTGSAKQTGDELDHLGYTIEAMATHLEQSQTESDSARQALQKSRDELEDRVKQRTQELLKTNDKLRDEIKERERIEHVLQQSALTDYLTGLPNRRAMIQLLDKEAARFQRSEHPFSLVLLDIDNFKYINDSFGHDGGDVILVAVAEKMGSWMREKDVLARWGGEEFLILLSDTNVESATEQAERLRTAIEGQDFVVQSKVTHLTVSLGVAGYNEADKIDNCIKEADIALYKAKSGGRNQVISHCNPE